MMCLKKLIAMKKLFVMAVVAIMATMNVVAQNVRHDIGSFTLQPMAGVSVGSMSGSISYYTLDYGFSSPRVETKDEMRLGFVGGLEAEYYINNWLSASAGVAYTMQGWRLKEKHSGEKFNQNLDYLNIPVLVNFYVAKGFALKVGFQPGFLLSAKYDGHDVKDAYESLNLSIPVGLSYEFKNGITIDWRGTLGLTTVNKHSTDDDKYHSDAGWLTVGYKFSL